MFSNRQPNACGFQLVDVISANSFPGFMKKIIYAVLLAVRIVNLPEAARAAAPIPPSITTQPVSQSVACGGTAQFSVVAAGSPPLSYSWTANGFPISPPATNA